jgi:hypothetical protein
MEIIYHLSGENLEIGLARDRICPNFEDIMPKGIYTRTANRGSNIIGKRFGRLIVIRSDKLHRSPSGEGRQYYLCKCDCGKEKVIRRQNLINKHLPTRSCGCLAIEKSQQRERLPHGEASFNNLYLTYIWGARIRNHKFELSKDQFRKITKEDCYYCGQKPSKEHSKKGTTAIGKQFYGNYIYNGIDRVDNKVGYTINNTVPCCMECNFFKKALSKDKFLSRIKKIYEYQLSKGANLP